jgi:hypothetical protein
MLLGLVSTSLQRASITTAFGQFTALLMYSESRAIRPCTTNTVDRPLSWCRHDHFGARRRTGAQHNEVIYNPHPCAPHPPPPPPEKNNESRREWCLEDDLLSADYPFLDPRFLPLADVEVRVPLLRICIAQLGMVLKVIKHDFDKEQAVGGWAWQA